MAQVRPHPMKTPQKMKSGPTLLTVLVLTAASVLPSYGADLVHHYPLDGNTYDVVGGADLKTPSGSFARFTSDAPKGLHQSISFGRGDDKTPCLVFPSVVRLPTSAGTIAFWAKVPFFTPGKTARYAFYAPSNEADAGLTTGCAIVLEGEGPRLKSVVGGKVVDAKPDDLSNWFHYVLAWSEKDGAASVYINGHLVGQQMIMRGPQPTDSFSLRLGNFSDNPENPDSLDVQFHGLISDFRIYKGVLPAEKIDKLVKP